MEVDLVPAVMSNTETIATKEQEGLVLEWSFRSDSIFEMPDDIINAGMESAVQWVEYT